MIVAELLKIQKQRGLTNSQFAESLGIHKISWYRNKRTNTISAEVLLRAFEVYPELRENFLASLVKGDHKTVAPTITPTRSETHHNGKLGYLRAWVRYSVGQIKKFRGLHRE